MKIMQQCCSQISSNIRDYATAFEKAFKRLKVFFCHLYCGCIQRISHILYEEDDYELR